MKTLFWIYNKVTESNLNTLITKIRAKCLNIDKEEHLACVTQLLENLDNATHDRAPICVKRSGRALGYLRLVTMMVKLIGFLDAVILMRRAYIW